PPLRHLAGAEKPAARPGVRMKMIKRSLLVSLCAPAFAVAQSLTPAVPLPAGDVGVDRIVAIVGDQPLLWSDILTAVNQRRAAGMVVPTDSAEQAAMARSVLSDL